MGLVIGLIILLPILAVIGIKNNNRDGKIFHAVKIFQYTRMDVHFASYCWEKYASSVVEVNREKFEVILHTILNSFGKEVVMKLESLYTYKELQEMHQTASKVFAPNFYELAPEAKESVQELVDKGARFLVAEFNQKPQIKSERIVKF